MLKERTIVIYETQLLLLATNQDRFVFTNDVIVYENYTSDYLSNRLGIPPPVYINVIRDPVERAISHFYYTKYGSGYDVKEPSHNVVSTELPPTAV